MTTKELELKEKLSQLTEEQERIINDYCANNMLKLKGISYNAFRGYNIPLSEYDDLYDDAMNVLLESVVCYDGNQAACFNTFLTNNIKNSVADWYRDNYKRAKRRNLLRDKNGNIIRVDKNGNVVKDGTGNPIIIYDTSFDAPPKEEENDCNLSEKVASDFNIEDESQFDFESDEKVEDFIKSLSKIQQQIVHLRMLEYPSESIKQKLGITESRYRKEIEAIKMNKGFSAFTKNKDDGNYKVEDKSMAERVIEISESENYRMDKMSIYSLLQDKKNGDMDCNYILQREPFQWTPEEANRYFCRILSNLPIPEIIICEQKKKGLTISHLIDGLQRLSYAEAFKENRMKISASGAERHLIQYREFELDENGNRIMDEDGLPKYEMKVFDVVGKYYRDLPEDLKKRFNQFNVNVTKFFDCTDEQIADHIRDYNNHASMNKEQGGLLNVSTETAGYIKYISQKNSFFKNCGKITRSNEIKGKLERVVAEAMMLLFFRNSWSAKLDTIYKYVDENATEQQFMKLNSHLNRLELAIGDNNQELNDMLTPTTMPMWIAVFDKFTTYNIDDSRFIDFLNAYRTELKDKEVNGISMADFKDQQTKKKTTITGKIDLLVKLMNEYLHINGDPVDDEKSEESNTVTNDTVIGFVQNNVNAEVNGEDISFYEDMVDDCVKIDSPVYTACKTALVAIMAYACMNDQDLSFEDWIKKYESNNSSFSPDQKVNYTYMKRDFDEFVKNLEENSKQKTTAVA